MSRCEIFAVSANFTYQNISDCNDVLKFPHVKISRGPKLALPYKYIRLRGDINIITQQLVLFPTTGQNITAPLCEVIAAFWFHYEFSGTSQRRRCHLDRCVCIRVDALMSGYEGRSIGERWWGDVAGRLRMPKLTHIWGPMRHIMGLRTRIRITCIWTWLHHVQYINVHLGLALRESFKFQFSATTNLDVSVGTRHSTFCPTQSE